MARTINEYIPITEEMLVKSHGRLIDADALKEMYGDWYTEEGTETGFIGTLKTLVDTMPTIEERKKGKWIRSKLHYKDGFNYYEDNCSECGVKRKIGWGDVNFCPNCGTDMRDRQRATWELDEKSNRHRCSECLSVASRDDNGAESLSDYCGVCGARMEKA